MSNKSNLDVAYDILSSSNVEMEFKTIWAEVVKIQELDPISARKAIGQFYTNLTLDGRFVTLGENIWDLRDRHTFDKVHIDMNDVYREVETTTEIDEEDIEYNKILDGDGEDDEYEDDEDNKEDKNDSDDDESDY